MTIQFYSHWNGQDGIKTLSSSEEARLVGLGVARYYLANMDGGPSDSLASVNARLKKSVLSFGAKCDGVTDDTVAVQLALDSGAGVVCIPPSASVLITSTLYQSSWQSLEGAGWGQSKILWRPTSAKVLIKNKAGATYCGVSDVEVNSLSNTNYAFQFSTSYGNFVKNTRITGVWDIGGLFHDTYVCQIDNVDTTGTSFKRFIFAVSKNSNAFSIRKLHTSSYPADAGIMMTGIAIEGGSAHVIDSPILQCMSAGIFIAEAVGTTVINPYFENTVVNVISGDQTRPATSKGTVICGGKFSGPYVSHPQYGNRGPIVYCPRTDQLTMVSPNFEVPVIASPGTSGPWPILAASTTGNLNITLGRIYSGSHRDLVFRDASGASPSLSITGGKYGSYGAVEHIMKADGAYAGTSAGIRVTSSGVVSADVYTPAIIAGPVNSMFTDAMPNISTLLA